MFATFFFISYLSLLSSSPRKTVQYLITIPRFVSLHEEMILIAKALGPVVQSIVSLTSSLRGQLVKCFTTLKPNILKFFVEKTREAFAVQKLLTFFQQKILAYLRY